MDGCGFVVVCWCGSKSRFHNFGEGDLGSKKNRKVAKLRHEERAIRRVSRAWRPKYVVSGVSEQKKEKHSTRWVWAWVGGRGWVFVFGAVWWLSGVGGSVWSEWESNTGLGGDKCEAKWRVWESEGERFF